MSIWNKEKTVQKGVRILQSDDGSNDSFGLICTRNAINVPTIYLLGVTGGPRPQQLLGVTAVERGG